MDARHASLGRRKLEEIRQKKAAERGSKSLGGSADSAIFGSTATGREFINLDSDASIQIQNLEEELKSLQSFLRKVQEDLQEQQQKNIDLSTKHQVVERGRNDLLQQLNDLEETKRRSLEMLLMEKDAAIVAREDLVAQLRIMKKRLQEAEEEQYKAEEDSAALRAELEMLHHRQESGGNVASSSFTPEQFRSMEQEMVTAKAELQNALRQVQQEQQKLAAERQRVAMLTAEKEKLQDAFNATHQKSHDDHETSIQGQPEVGPSSSANISRDGVPSLSMATSSEIPKDKNKHDYQLRELASMVERLENGRQKLLAEIDVQSLEIERLFVENSSLMTGLKEATEAVGQWEGQVRECLKENAELRAMLNVLRMEQAHLAKLHQPEDLANREITEECLPNNSNVTTEMIPVKEENTKLKLELAKAQGQAEALNAKVFQLSADLNRAIFNLNSLSRLYKPMLSNIENQLLQLKQDGHFVDTVL